MNPVTVETSVTAIPASAIVLAVEPVDTISTPDTASALASSIRPDLSETEINARLIGTLSK